MGTGRTAFGGIPQADKGAKRMPTANAVECKAAHGQLVIGKLQSRALP